MESQSSRGRAAVRIVFTAAELALIALLIGTAATYGAVYIARWLDDAAYHIPGAVRIARHLNPYFVEAPVDTHWFPAGAETFAALFVVAAQSINATNASGALCFAGLCAIVYAAAGLWTRDLVPRLACVLCAASMPLLLGQCLAFYVDIHFAVLVCAALWLQAASLVYQRSQYAWAALVAAILTASVKYSGIYTLAVLIPGCAICLWLASAPRRPSRLLGLLLIAATLFTAGFYVRNWMVRGNPLYPFDLPAWARTLASLSPAAYEADPMLLGGVSTLQRVATFPHPWLPASLTTVKLKPDMTDDAFGAAGALALLAAAASLLFLRGIEATRRRAWLLLLGESLLFAALFPLRGAVPRFVLFLPLVASLSPAVFAAVRGAAARLATGILCAVIFVNAAGFAWFNLLADTGEWTSLQRALPLLVPYRPNGMRAIGYAQSGNLRIGYTSGFGNLIALLYDPGLTNELVPLHYRDYPVNHWRQFDSPEAFIEHVRSLNLDYIQIFDPRYPGVDLLKQNFPDKVRLPP